MCRACLRLENQEEWVLQLYSEDDLEAESLLQETSSFSRKALTDWVRPNHIMKSNL